MAPSHVRRVNETPMSTVNLNHTMPGTNFIVTTENGTVYEVRRDFHPTDPGPANYAMAHVYLTTGGEESTQYTQAIITVGNPWRISADKMTSKVISIKQP